MDGFHCSFRSSEGAFRIELAVVRGCLVFQICQGAQAVICVANVRNIGHALDVFDQTAAALGMGVRDKLSLRGKIPRLFWSLRLPEGNGTTIG